ncbi:DUF6879 family protein [Streptomyces sp. NBC_00063]|uniref:DUF6879 family protein n=1 Tax=Streptomyces sp. NBC_00063 TaxID=2975638 RepID=UPI003D72B96D
MAQDVTPSCDHNPTKGQIMARRLRCNGTGSGGTGCPTVHEDLDTGDVIFHGPPLTQADGLGQLQPLSPGEVAVVIPRHVVVDFAPKEMERVVRIIGLDEFENLFRTFEHSAWRLESRRRYASDESTETYIGAAELSGPRRAVSGACNGPADRCPWF